MTAFVSPASGETFWYLRRLETLFRALLETFARKAMAGGMSEAEVEECFALAAYEAFPEPRITERLCQVFAAAL